MMKKMRFDLCFAVVLSIITMLVFVSCDKNDPVDEGSYYSNLYADSVYLSIEGDLEDPEIIWGSVDTYLQALDRMRRHACEEDGLMTWDFESASELNISENIFNYVVGFWKYINEHPRKASSANDLGARAVKGGSFLVKFPDGSFVGINFPLKLKESNSVNFYENYNIAWIIYCLVEYNGFYPKLKDVIDLEASPFRSDGAGGVCILGVYGKPGTVEYKSYVVSNACAYNKDKYNCEFNEISYLKRSHEKYGNVVTQNEQVCNRSLLTLVSFKASFYTDNYEFLNSLD